MNYKLLIPKGIKPFLKKLHYQFALNSPWHGAMPPTHSIFIGGGDFKLVDQILLKQLVDGDGLKPTD